MSDPPTALSVHVHRSKPPTVKLAGQADFHNKQRISEAFDRLFNRGHADVRADLGELEYIDSSALSELIRCATKAWHAGGAIELVCVSSRIARMLTLCGAAAFFTSSVRDIPVCGEEGRAGPSEGCWYVSDFSLPACPAAAATARSRVADVVESLALGATESHDVMVAVGEALANAIKHGCACNPQMRITVKCIAGPYRLAIDISDPGAGFSLSGVREPSPESLTEGGMGIHMMRRSMDQVLFSFDAGTTVRLVKFVGHRVRKNTGQSSRPVEA